MSMENEAEQALRDERAETKRRQMLGEKIPKLILKMALPTTLSQLIAVIYSMVDTFFVSGISTEATASVSIGFSLLSFIQAIGFGFAMGAGSLVSMLLGKKEKDKADSIASSACFAAVGVAIVFLIFGLSFIRPFMMLLGASETTVEMAADYARFIIIASPFMCASYVLNVTLRSEGHAVYAMIGLVVGGLLNIGLDAWFVVGLQMGVSGASLATMVSQLTSLAILLIPYLAHKSIVRISPFLMSRHFKDYANIVRLGFPTIARQGLASLATAMLNNQARPYGAAAVGAIGIAYKVYLLGRQLTIGIGQGFMPVAGYNYSQKENARVRKAFWFSVLLATIICTVLSAFMAVFPRQIISFFRDDPELVEPGTKCLYYLAIALPLMGYSTLVNQMYQCLGYSFFATILACCRQGILFIPLVLWLPLVWGLDGVCAVQAGADILTFLVSIPAHIYFFAKALPIKKAAVTPPEAE